MPPLASPSWLTYAARACGALLLLAFSALAWRLAYVYTDWAALSLLPLFLALYLAARPLHQAIWQGRAHLMVRPGSGWAPWLRGRIRSAWRAASFATVTVLVVAWQALVLPQSQAPLYAALVLIAALAFIYGVKKAQQQLQPPYAQWATLVATSWLLTLPFMGMMAYLNWSQQHYPEFLLNASLAETLQYSLQALPRQTGWIAEALAIVYAYEAAKLWLVLQYPQHTWLALLFCLEAGLVGLVIARSSMLLMQLWDSLGNQTDEPS